MNLVKNKAMHPQLRDEEALVVENAIRLAIDSIVNVLYGVNSARSREYQRMVADRDKEIQRLESRLTEMEQVMRQQGCTCGLLGSEHSFVGSQSSGDRLQAEPSCLNQDCIDQQQCEMSISLGLYARPPSQVSSQSNEAAPLSSPSRVSLDQTSYTIEASGVSEAATNMSSSPRSSIIIKDEPCDIDAVLIKWEMSEERFGGEHQQKTLDNREGESVREKPQADTDGHQLPETEHLRNKKKSIPMSQLPEEAQRLKRAAWRAASRRYYARKIARQQGNPPRSVPFHHLTNSQYPLPLSLVDQRKGTLISTLSEDAQALQREAWRASSRRYYARKMARPQVDPPQYEHLHQNTEASGETPGSNRGASHSSSGGLGGILCS